MERFLFALAGGFLYSKVPKASIRNKYLGLHTSVSRKKFSDICRVCKLILLLALRRPHILYFVSHTKTEPEKILINRSRSKLKVALSPRRAVIPERIPEATRCVPSSLSLCRLKRSVKKSQLTFEV